MANATGILCLAAHTYYDYFLMGIRFIWAPTVVLHISFEAMLLQKYWNRLIICFSSLKKASSISIVIIDLSAACSYSSLSQVNITVITIQRRISLKLETFPQKITSSKLI